MVLAPGLVHVLYGRGGITLASPDRHPGPVVQRWRVAAFVYMRSPVVNLFKGIPSRVPIYTEANAEVMPCHDTI